MLLKINYRMSLLFLKAFHKEILTENNNNSKTYYDEESSYPFYEEVAWGGLKDTPVYDAKSQ